MTYHEYFIGGPMDGQIQSRKGGAPEYSRQRDGDGFTTEEIITWLYRPTRIAIGNTVLTVWTDPRMLTEMQIRARLWEIILEPHKFIPDVPTERRTS